MSAGLTPTLSRILDFISAFIERKGHSPSYEEMLGAGILRSKGALHAAISRLEERGYIRRVAHNRARSIEVIDRSRFGPTVEQHLRRYCSATGQNRDAVIRQAVEQFLEVRG